MSQPKIIQGGMGVAVSGWKLARAVAMAGQLGVVSGTGLAYVLMGAGIPRAIPGLLDQLAKGEPAQLKIDVIGSQAGEEFFSTFDPKEFWSTTAPVLKRPQFLGIVASATLALTLAKKASG